MPNNKKTAAKDAIKHLDKAISYKTRALDESVANMHTDIISMMESFQDISRKIETINTNFYGIRELSESIIESSSKRDSLMNILDLKGSSKVTIDDSVPTMVKSMEDISKSETKPQKSREQVSLDDCSIDELKNVVKFLYDANFNLERRVDSLQLLVNKLLSKDKQETSSEDEDSEYMKTPDYD